MGVTAWPRLVLSWPKLVEGWERTRGDQFRFDAGEAGELWLESYRAPGFNDNWHAASEASEIYDALRPSLDGDLRSGCDWLCSFFWNGATPPRAPGLTAFAVSLNPSAVTSFAALGNAVDLDLLRPGFAAAEEDLHLGWFETFEDFAAYVRQWVTLLNDAAARGAGVVVTIA